MLLSFTRISLEFSEFHQNFTRISLEFYFSTDALWKGALWALPSDFENAETLRFIFAPQKIAAIFSAILPTIFWRFLCDFCSKTCDFCTLRFENAIAIFLRSRLFWGAKSPRRKGGGGGSVFFLKIPGEGGGVSQQRGGGGG